MRRTPPTFAPGPLSYAQAEALNQLARDLYNSLLGQFTASAPLEVRQGVEGVNYGLSVNSSQNPSLVVRKNSGTPDFGPRRRLNLIEGSNVTLTVADDSTNNEVDVTIAASGGGSGITFVEVDGTPSVANVTNAAFDSADGFRLTDLGGGAVRLDIAPASVTDTGVVNTTTQHFSGDKFVDARLGVNFVTGFLPLSGTPRTVFQVVGTSYLGGQDNYFGTANVNNLPASDLNHVISLNALAQHGSMFVGQGTYWRYVITCPNSIRGATRLDQVVISGVNAGFFGTLDIIGTDPRYACNGVLGVDGTWERVTSKGGIVISGIVAGGGLPGGAGGLNAPSASPHPIRSSSPVWFQAANVAPADVPASATQFEVYSQRAGYQVDQALIEIVEPFDSSLPGTITLDLGVSGSPTSYVGAFDLKQTIGSFGMATPVSVGSTVGSLSNNRPLYARVNYTGALTKGKVRIHLREWYINEVDLGLGWMSRVPAAPQQPLSIAAEAPPQAAGWFPGM